MKVARIVVIMSGIFLFSAACTGLIPGGENSPSVQESAPAESQAPAVPEEDFALEESALEEPTLEEAITQSGIEEPESEGAAVQEAPFQQESTALSYPIVDTGQAYCYSDQTSIPCPEEGEPFYGQDAQYQGAESQYLDHGDGTITDTVTGLMWQKTPDASGKATFKEALDGAETLDLAGYQDWRLPTIQELYSLIDFRGSSTAEIPYLDLAYFDFEFGNTSQGERFIDAQYWSSTVYQGVTMRDNPTAFGVNFADGRIKGYPIVRKDGQEMEQFVRYVRGNPDYGVSDFIDNGDGTITDQAAGLTWLAEDSGDPLDWEGALAYCETLEAAGASDWRLPNAKELHSLVDYSRGPQSTGTAAIDPMFSVSEDESWYWTSTTHLDSGVSSAVYLAFGQAFGLPDGRLVDVHGAGAQRSDPKSGDPAEYAGGRGSPGQQDQVRIYNYARCVRGGVSNEAITGGEADAVDRYQPGQPQGGEQAIPQEPPQAAVASCASLSLGDTCTFQGREEELRGICRAVQTGQLACVPSVNPTRDE